MLATAPPLLSLRRAALALCVATLLLWPMVWVTAPIVYFDSFAYAGAGMKALDLVRDALIPAGGAGGVAGGGVDVDGAGSGFLRSAAWSVFVAALGGLPWGAVIACLLQTAGALLVLGMLVPPGAAIRLSRAFVSVLAVGTLSGLPWYASYAMPDILGALVVAYYAALLGPLAHASRAVRFFAMALACFAVLSHYGHLPLAAALAAVILLLRLPRPGLPLAVAALLPFTAAVVLNGATGLILDQVAAPPSGIPSAEAALAGPPSVTPGRLPIVLARSIGDGVALPHLQEACARDAYRSCAFLGELPGTVGGFLWSRDGIRKLDVDEMEVLRAEEMRIVLDAALARPLLQAQAVAQNVALQILRVGTDEMLPLSPLGADGTYPVPAATDAAAFPILGWADLWIPAFTLLSALALTWRLAAGRLNPVLVAPTLVVFAGIAINAGIFGGLSYPVDRYGGRIVWLLPALLAIDLALAPKSRTSQVRGVLSSGRGRARCTGIVWRVLHRTGGGPRKRIQK